jgi:endonuclease/exonuclease/phosphatase family metal-dependent hydrolase
MAALSNSLVTQSIETATYATVSPSTAEVGGSARVRVLTWNILVPIFCDPALYPGVPQALLNAEARRSQVHRQLADAGADVLLLQECALEELEVALVGPLRGHGHVYCGVVEEAQKQLVGSQDWGVAIAWREGALRNCEQVTLSVQGAFGALPVALIRAFVVSWGEEVFFVCAHLDGEGCPPSTTRSEQQARAIATQVIAEADRVGVHRIVWGGDFNQPVHSKALRDVTSSPDGLLLVSGKPTLPTCYVAVLYSRIDHVLARGCVSLATEIPECPITHCYKGMMPGFYQGAIALDYLGMLCTHLILALVNGVYAALESAP